MPAHFQQERLALVHEVSDLVDKSGMWLEIVRLGMSREFVERSMDFYGRMIMELDCIEKGAPHVVPDARKLRSRVAHLALEEKRRHDVASVPRVA